MEIFTILSYKVLRSNFAVITNNIYKDVITKVKALIDKL